MRAVVPADPGEVTFAEVENPEPQANEVLITVDAFSVNRGETFLLEHPQPNWRPGKDIAGVVLRAADDGSGPDVGQRVVAHPPASGWAEVVAVPTDRLAELPSTVDSIAAAALPLAGLTALRLLRAAGSVAGQRILLTGASGGVGHYVVELASAAGARVTAVSASTERGARLRELGAAEVCTSIDDVAGEFDLVLESVGGEATSKALRHLTSGGTLIWFGQASRRPVTLDFFEFYGFPAMATIRTFHYEHPADAIGADLATLVRLVADDRLHPEIGVCRKWTDVGEVLVDLRERRVRGNAVLTVRPQPEPVRDAKTVVSQYVRALQDGDVEARKAAFHPDATWHIPGDGPLSGDYVGPDEIFGKFYDNAVRRFDPNTVRLALRHVLADGPFAVAEWRTTGKTITGAAYDNSYAVIFEVRAGKIANVREYLDTKHFDRALFGTE